MNSREIIENYFGIIQGERQGDLFECMSDDVIWHLPPHHPMGGEFNGKAAVGEMMAKGMPMFEDGSLKFEIHAIVADGEDAFAHFNMRARTSAGDDYDNMYIFRFRVKDDKIAEIWEVMDTLYMSGLKLYEMIGL